jgi:hypothetical protein
LVAVVGQLGEVVLGQLVVVTGQLVVVVGHRASYYNFRVGI